MKKVLSVFLAVLIAAICMTPAFAAGETHTVTFVAPSAALDNSMGDAYAFIPMTDGHIAAFHEIEDWSFAEEPSRGYIYYEPDDMYYLYEDIIYESDRQMFQEGTKRYEPDSYKGAKVFEDGKILSFCVFTNAKYDASTVIVTVNGEKLSPKTNGEYSVTVDRALTIAVREKDDAYNDILLRNHYSITLPSGEGYSVKPLKGENNRYVYYGDTFKFRVKIGKGYSQNDMKVKAYSTGNDLTALFGEDASSLSGLLDRSAPLTCLGVDEDGCYLYETAPITSDSSISVSGVREESKSGVIAMLKRILRIILHAFGIDVSFLEDLVGTATVDFDTSAAVANGISYEVSASVNDNPTPQTLDIMTGEGITVKFTKKSEDQSVRVYVARTLLDDNGDPVIEGGAEKRTVQEFPLEWTAHYNRYTGEYTWTALCYISSINSHTTVTVTA